MGFVLSVLYFVTYYLTPSVLFGPLVVARVELILAALIFLISLFSISKSIILKTPQSVALIGLAFAGSFSVLFGMQWVSGAVQAFPAFLPCAYAYFLVCLHCNSKIKLQIIVLMMLIVCLFVIAHGYIDLRYGVPNSGPPLPAATGGVNLSLWDIQHPYLLAQRNDTGEFLYRLRGLGLINDPNDFGQLIVCLIPLLFIFWRPKKVLRNIVFVALPVCVLLFGTFLTHSRGALLALMAIMILAARRRTGTLPALLIAGCVFVAAMSLNFTGGRDISANAGSDRTTLWGEGLQMLKSHPLFGVGLNTFTDNCDNCGHTAHNSLVVCAAELGLFGLYFWCLFLFPTARDALAIASPAKVTDAGLAVPEERHLLLGTSKIEAVDKAEINRLGRLLVLSLTGFLVAGWFLSRAYVMTFFLLGGMVEVVYEMALRRGMIAPRLRMARVLSYSGGLAVLLVLLMYVLLRTVNLMH
jgi:O-Antigen ligase